MKPVVAHIAQSFFVRSETFIYQFLNNFIDFKPVCLAAEFQNLNFFPFPKNSIYHIGNRAFSKKWCYKRFKKWPLDFTVYRAEYALRRTKSKIIHAHFGQSGVFALKANRRLNLPLVTTFYGYDVSKLGQSEEWKIKFKALFAGGDLFLVEGPFMRSKLIELGCPETKVKIQRIGIPVEKISFVPRTPKVKKEKVILIFAGRFVEKKGLMYALKAVKLVRKDRENFEFRIIGDGPLAVEIKNYIDQHGMSGYAKLLGFLNYTEYLNEIQKADIFIHPSVTASDGDSEGGAPTSILEAQAMGMPIISTTHADIPNIVVSGKSALLSPERNSKELANDINYLLDNQNLWGEMGKIGREFVQKYHNINQEIVSLEEHYKGLLHNY